MRRKSDRTASKTTKASPEKKVEKEKPKRTTRRSKKQSTSSENVSADEGTPVRQSDTVETEVKEPPATPAKEPSPEDTPDQVWQVKSAQGSGDTGEIQKLKICLKRPPSTPERVDRSPRSRRKHARATSSSDTPSLDGSEEKKKKHKSRRATRESKDEGSEKQNDSQTDEPEKEQGEIQAKECSKPENEISQSTEPTTASTSDDTPMSTSTEEVKPEQSGQSTEKTETKSEKVSDEKDKQSDADTTVSSPKQAEDKQSDDNLSKEQPAQGRDNDSPVHVIEIQTSPEQDTDKQEESKKESQNEPRTEEQSADTKVSKPEENKSEKAAESPQGKTHATNENDVVEKDNDKVRKMSTDSTKDKDVEDSRKTYSQELERSESMQSTQGESIPNGQAFTPLVVNRKRRWGTRPKVATQKSITISTDVLKDIIPDVKPAEFDEVIEEKKHHKRVEMSERIERPVLPKIVIDNTESIEPKREREEKENVKYKEPLPLSNRKISIVKDTDDLILRPLSPPRHKQSCVLYISNLVRPFTLPQLKNLLQRTGRIVEDGFWIDKIKSRCFVIYENEDQAVETRHALHGVQWPPSNPKLLQVDFSSQEAFDKAKANEDVENAPASAIPGTVEDWLREQDLKRERGELDKPWDRKPVREWDVGKGDKIKDDKLPRDPRDERSLDKRRHRTPERSPEPARKFKKKEEEAPAKLLDDLFRKTKTTPCIYWLPLSAETIAVKEEQRRQHMAEHERRISELRRHRERRH